MGYFPLPDPVTPGLRELQRLLVEASVAAIKTPKKVIDKLREMEVLVSKMIAEDVRVSADLDDAEAAQDERQKVREARLDADREERRLLR